MLSNIQKNIIVRALWIRHQAGEDPAEAVKDYMRLTEEEQAEVLTTMVGGPTDGK